MFLTRNLLIALSYFYYFSEKEKNLTIETYGIGTWNLSEKREIKNLRAAFAAVGTPNEFDVAATVLVATSIPALERLQKKKIDRTMRKERRKKKVSIKLKTKIEENREKKQISNHGGEFRQVPL